MKTKPTQISGDIKVKLTPKELSDLLKKLRPKLLIQYEKACVAAIEHLGSDTDFIGELIDELTDAFPRRQVANSICKAFKEKLR